MTKYYCGGDPGASGAIVVVSEDRTTLEVFRTPDKNAIYEWAELGREIAAKYPNVRGYVEKSHPGAARGASAKQSTSSLMTQGSGQMAMAMCLAAAGVPIARIYPAKWVGWYGMKRGGAGTTEWKNRLNERAMQLYAGHKFPKYAADAVLIAEMARANEGDDPKTIGKRKDAK